MELQNIETRQLFTVATDDTARRLGSGSLEVLATPRLVAMMEATACAAIEGKLPEGETSVGVRIDIQHLAASAVGASVEVTAVLKGQDGRKLHFHIEAYCNDTLIGRAEHDRVVVSAQRFMDKLTQTL